MNTIENEKICAEPLMDLGAKIAPAISVGRLVLIEDDDCINRAVSLYLRAKGHTVESFSGAAAAKNWISANQCDLLITDILMPDSDGLEVIRWCRTNQPSMKIIAISGTDPWGHSHLRVAGLLGASRLVQKPFDLASLANVVGEVLLLPA
jgi:DNA-binding response OmpR family regulator